MTPDREKYLLPMLLGYEQRNVHYLLSPTIKNIEQYQSPTQFGSLIFGLLRGSYYGPYIKNIDTKVSTVFTNDIDQLMSLLLSGRIDIMPIQNLKWAEVAFDKVKHQHPDKNYQVAGFKESFFSVKYLSIPKSSPLTGKYHQLNCKLFKMRDAGTIDNLYQQYLIPPYIQFFDNNESLQQLDSCLRYQETLELLENR
jgi:polar amino acid transport system substrate-binding protein